VHLALDQNFGRNCLGEKKVPAMVKVQTTDSDIRLALHAKRLNRVKAQPDTLVIDELGLAHAKSRIDIAVINGCIHGYEIKSSMDTLDRLGTQLGVYQQTLQKLTIVAAQKHIKGVMAKVPSWCGVMAVDRGPRGAIGFHVLRNAAKNPNIDPVMMAHLLWHHEVVDLLRQLEFAAKELRRPRRHLYEMLCEAMTVGEITTSIRQVMVRRQAWRVRSARA
jgi:hypothetical protein